MRFTLFTVVTGRVPERNFGGRSSGKCALRETGNKCMELGSLHAPGHRGKAQVKNVDNRFRL